MIFNRFNSGSEEGLRRDVKFGRGPLEGFTKTVTSIYRYKKSWLCNFI